MSIEIKGVIIGEGKPKVCVPIVESHDEAILNKLKEFNELEKTIKKRLILYVTKRLKGSSKGVEMIHIEDIIKLCNNNIGNKFLTPNKNLKILVKDKKIFFISK